MLGGVGGPRSNAGPIPIPLFCDDSPQNVDVPFEGLSCTFEINRLYHGSLGVKAHFAVHEIQ